jgi:hypothetical protein
MMAAIDAGCQKLLVCSGEEEAVQKVWVEARALAKAIYDQFLQLKREHEEEQRRKADRDQEKLSRSTTVDAASEEIAAVYTDFLASIRAAYNARGKAVADQLRVPTTDPEQHAHLVQSSSDEASKLIASTMERGNEKREEIVAQLRTTSSQDVSSLLNSYRLEVKALVDALDVRLTGLSVDFATRGTVQEWLQRLQNGGEGSQDSTQRLLGAPQEQPYRT